LRYGKHLARHQKEEDFPEIEIQKFLDHSFLAGITEFFAC